MPRLFVCLPSQFFLSSVSRVCVWNDVDRYTHMLVAQFPSREALAAYDEHPVHVKFVQECVLPFKEDVHVMDIEC